MIEETGKIKPFIPNDMLKADLEFWRDQFRQTHSEYSARRCEEIYKEINEIKDRK